MTDKGTHAQEMNKEVQHSKTQGDALALRGVGMRTLKRSSDRLSEAQADLYVRMRDQGAKICVTGDLAAAPDGPAALEAFRGARMAKGREITRFPDFDKMPYVTRTLALRSMTGGHVALVGSDPKGIHHYYGLNERGLAVLAEHQAARRKARQARPTE